MNFEEKHALAYYEEIQGYIKPSHTPGICEFCGKKTNWAIIRFGIINTPAGYDYIYCCSEDCLGVFKAELVEEITGGKQRKPTL